MANTMVRRGVWAVACLALTGAVATADWFDNQWWDRREVLFDNSASGTALTGFPAMVHLNASNFDFTRAQASGQDLRFTDSNGTALLKHEIEKWDSAGQEAWIWVRVPQVDAGATTDKVYMYSMNPAAADSQDMAGTWDSGFRMVHHLQETSGTHLDSTSYSNDGTWIPPTKSGNPATQDAQGKIGGGNLFWGIGTHPNDPAVNDKTRVDVPHDPSLRGNLSITVEAWYNQQENVAGEDHIARVDGEWMLNLASGTSSTAVRFGRAGSGWSNGSNVIWSNIQPDMDEWHYAVGTAEWDGVDTTTMRIYVDGLLRGTGSIQDTLSLSGSSPIRIGARNDTYGPNFFHGPLDEIRYSATARSGDWVHAQYLSMTDEFVTFGEFEQVPEPASVLLLLGGLAALARRRSHRRGR